MRIIGIDPGIERTGFAIIEKVAPLGRINFLSSAPAEPDASRSRRALAGLAEQRLGLREKNNVYLRDFGYITTDKKEPFSKRLSLIASDLRNILRQWKPSVAALEEVFFSKNVKTALKVSHSRGVVMEILEEHGISILEFNPSHIKLALTGDSRADKLQMKKMLAYLLGITIKNDDTVDAIACALAALNAQRSAINI